METVNLVIHHGGSWTDTENMVYSGRKVEWLDNFDIDYLSFHELQWHCRNWGYEMYVGYGIDYEVLVVVKLLKR